MRLAGAIFDPRLRDVLKTCAATTGALQVAEFFLPVTGAAILGFPVAPYISLSESDEREESQTAD